VKQEDRRKLRNRKRRLRGGCGRRSGLSGPADVRGGNISTRCRRANAAGSRRIGAIHLLAAPRWVCCATMDPHAAPGSSGTCPYHESDHVY